MISKDELLATGYFVENEYFDKYLELVESNKNTQEKKFRTNNHHILPYHYFINNGLQVDNSSKNIVTLQFKDHLLAHFYLSGCTKGRYKYWNLYSIFLMSGHTFSLEDEESVRNLYERIDYTKIYEEAITAAPNHRKGTKVSEETHVRMLEAARKRVAENGTVTKGTKWVHKDTKDYMVPENELELYLENGFELGRSYKHTPETKEKCAKASETRKKNGTYTSPEYIEKLSQANTGKTHSRESIEQQKLTMKEYYKTHSGTFKGKKHTEESKRKNSESHKGKLAVRKDGIVKMVDASSLKMYLEQGWERKKK